MVQGVGFEPTKDFTPPGLQPGAINHSTTPAVFYRLLNGPKNLSISKFHIIPERQPSCKLRQAFSGVQIRSILFIHKENHQERKNRQNEYVRAE